MYCKHVLCFINKLHISLLNVSGVQLGRIGCEMLSRSLRQLRVSLLEQQLKLFLLSEEIENRNKEDCVDYQHIVWS